MTATGAGHTHVLGSTTVPGISVGIVTNGLDTGIADSSSITMCTVFKYETGSGFAIINGNLGTGSTGVGGHSFYIDPTNNLLFNERNGIGNKTVRTAAQMVEGNYYFIASSCQALSTTVMIADVTSTSFSDTYTGSGRAVAARNMSLGNMHYANTIMSDDAIIAETIFFDTAKTLSELNVISSRSRTRMLARGITVQ